MLQPEFREWAQDNGMLILAAFLIPVIGALAITLVKPLRHFFDRFKIWS